MAIKQRLSQNFVCIDWDERSLRALDVAVSRGGLRIRRAVHVDVPDDVNATDPEAMGEFLKRALAEHRIRTRRAIVDIPRHDAVLNMMTLPDGSTDDLASMVHIQLAKELPFSKEEAVIDFAVARQKGSPTCEVWVSAVRNHVIDYYRRTATAAGLRLERIGLRPYATLTAVTSDTELEGRVLVVDIGPSMTEISVVANGRLAYSRSASVTMPPGGPLGGVAGGEPGEGDEPAGTVLSMQSPRRRRGPMDALLVDVSRTVEAYRAFDPGARIERIILSGTAGIGPEVAKAFEERFMASAGLFTVPASLRWAGAPGQSATPFIAAVGLALGTLSESTARFDFLNPKEPEAERRERAKRVPYLAAGVAVLLAAGGVAAYMPIHKNNVEIAGLKAEITKLNRDEKARKAFLKQYEQLDFWADTSTRLVDDLRRLAELFPSNELAYITRMHFDQRGTLEIDLAARNKEIATELAMKISALEVDGKQPYVARAHSPSERKNDPQYRYDDKVTVTIKPLQPPSAKRR